MSYVTQVTYSSSKYLRGFAFKGNPLDIKAWVLPAVDAKRR